MQNQKQTLANQMQRQTQLFKQDVQERNERANKEEVTNTYIGKKKHPKETSKVTSKTVFNFIPLPFNTDDGQRSVRLISDCFNILFDTDIPYDSGSGTKKKFFSIASIKEFRAYESAFGVKVLSPEDEALLKEVQNKLWTIREYFPYFDNAINANLKHLSVEFLEAYKGKLRINYFPYYMLVPSIELSEEIYSPSQGDSTSKIKKYSLLHFSKIRLIEDWNAWMDEWQENPSKFALQGDDKLDFASLFEKAFSGPDNIGNISRYLSITITDDAPKFNAEEKQEIQVKKTTEAKKTTEDKNGNAPNRLTKFAVKKYIPELFASEENGPLEITPELLSQVKNLYDMPNFFKVASFERENYEDLLSVLNMGMEWLRKEGIVFDDRDNRTSITQSTKEPSIAEPPQQPIEEDEVPF